MCGIVGYIGPERPGIIERMMRSVAHRGPDAGGVWHDSKRQVHFGHTRLVIVDRAGGQQPMATVDGDYVVVFNGEIYNAGELRKELESRGHRFVSARSDTEVLLHGYREWGPNLSTRLIGMWAFALFDLRHQSLFLCRDRMGEKPLFYTKTPTAFIFASELSALRAHPDCPRDFDHLSIKKLFAYGFIPSPRTLLRNVYKISAGHSAHFDILESRLTEHSYWRFRIEPDYSFARRSEDSLSEELLHLLEVAVKRQLNADVNVGVLLSGGVDSSAVAALATRLRPGVQIASFCIGFEDPSFDETHPAQSVAHALRTHHRVERFQAQEAAAIFASVQPVLDEPSGDPSLLPTFALCRLARRHVGVALGGDGGDELFAGYDTFRALHYASLLSRMPRSVHRALGALAASLPVSHRNLSWDFKIKRFLRGVVQPEHLWHPVWLGPLGPTELEDLFQEPTDVEAVYSEAFEVAAEIDPKDSIDQGLEFYSRLYLPDNILTKVDRASMLNGLEVRSPFLDAGVVEFARKLPSFWKLRNGCTKYLLKRALQRILPANTLARPKKGFGLPIGRWYRDGLLPLNLGPVGLGLNLKFLDAAKAAHLEGRQDHRQVLWCASSMGDWARRSPAP